jgi:hypothetical protein
VKKGAEAEGMTLKEYLWRGHDPTAVAVMMEDGAAVAGLAVAGLALAAVEFTGQRIWDPIGSIVVGQLLGVVCINSDHLCPWFTDVEGSFICPLPYEKSPGLPQICLLNLSCGIIFHHVICLSLPVCFCGFCSHMNLNATRIISYILPAMQVAIFLIQRNRQALLGRSIDDLDMRRVINLLISDPVPWKLLHLDPGFRMDIF